MSVSKVTLRENCLKKLKTVTPHQKYYRDKRVNQRLLDSVALHQAKTVLAFWPLGLESDIRNTLVHLRRHKKVYMPFMEGVSFKMVPLRLPLHKKRFGIFEPGNSNLNIKKVDVAIVPIVGVDGEGRRVGFGKGMYDRFFGRLKTKPYVIFVQSKLCNTTKYICDDYDVMADQIITPRASYRVMKGTNYDKRNHLRRWHSHT